MLNQAPSGSYLCLSKQYSGPSAATVSFLSLMLKRWLGGQESDKRCPLILVSGECDTNSVRKTHASCSYVPAQVAV